MNIASIDITLMSLSQYLDKFLSILCTWIVRESHLEEFYKKGVLKIPEDSQENICAEVSFAIKLQTGDLPLH